METSFPYYGSQPVKATPKLYVQENAETYKDFLLLNFHSEVTGVSCEISMSREEWETLRKEVIRTLVV